jgi:hypothetical protein
MLTISNKGGDHGAMDDDSPTTGDPIADALAKALRWLHQQADQLFPQPHEAARPAPADMTDKQLQQDIHNVGGNLLNEHGPMIMSGFARYGTATTDPRFKHAMPTTVRGHLLNMTADANDSYGLALRGLNKHAHASALGAIRNVAEILGQASWLLEDLDDRVRQARAYRLTLNAINQYHLIAKTLRRVTKDSEQPSDLATQLDAAEERMRRSLTAITEQDGITIPDNPGKPSKLIERYLPEHGGYMLYALLSSAGVHPGAGRAYLFYGQPGTGVSDYDFQGKHLVRGYWTAQNIKLYLALGHLAAPILDWHGWDAIANTAETNLRPLAEEAERRYMEPMLQAMADAAKRN